MEEGRGGGHNAEMNVVEPGLQMLPVDSLYALCT